MAIQPHRLDNASDKLWGFFYPCGIISVDTLQQELEPKILSVRQQCYIRGLIDQYYNRAYAGVGILFGVLNYLDLNYVNRIVPLEKRMVSFEVQLGLEITFVAFGVFLKYQNQRALAQLQARAT